MSYAYSFRRGLSIKNVRLARVVESKKGHSSGKGIRSLPLGLTLITGTSARPSDWSVTVSWGVSEAFTVRSK